MSTEHSQPLRVEVGEQADYPVVRPIGEVDIASVPALQTVLTELLDAGRARLVVDLEGLDYLDSTGLGCVTAARRQALNQGGELVLVCTRERILRLFSITGLDQVFTICRGVPEAVARLGAGQ